MGEKFKDTAIEIDTGSSLLICRAVGDALRKRLLPDTSELPDRLDALLQQLDREDEAPLQRRQVG